MNEVPMQVTPAQNRGASAGAFGPRAAGGVRGVQNAAPLSIHNGIVYRSGIGWAQTLTGYDGE